MKLVYITCIIILFNYCYCDETCATYQCGTGEACCYDDQQRVICYDITQYTCTADGKLLQGSALSVPPPLFCSSSNLNPCGPGQMCCDGQCYDPNAYVCLNSFLCPIGHSVCGGGSTKCYNLQSQECCNNQIYANGTSDCSKSTATCCSCTCSQVIPSTTGYTVDGPAQCSADYIANSNLPAPSCLQESTGCSTGQEGSCGFDCGSNNLIFDRCENYGSSCGGTFQCDGGAYSCSVKAGGQCNVTVVNTGTSVTTLPDYGELGPSPFSYIPPDYTGEICCWCGSQSTLQAIATPVPTQLNCTVAYVFSDFPLADLVCRPWSIFTHTSTSVIPCGFPSP